MFFINNKNIFKLFSNSIESLSAKLNIKKTAYDMQKLNGFLNKTITDNKLKSTINKTARLDDDFSIFLKDFKQKNPNFPTILDLSRFSNDENNTGNNDNNPKYEKKLSADEHSILEEFKKRANEKRQSKLTDLNRPDELSSDFLQCMTDFAYIILERKSTTNVTRLGRVNTMKYLIFCGNGDGVIGYGRGKGSDFEIALKNAIKNCRKNLITIDYDFQNSFIQYQKHRFMSVTLELRECKNFQPWGNPIFGTMVQMAGITNLGFKLLYRKPKYLAITYVYFMLITRNKTPKQMAELYGCKVTDLGFAVGNKAWDLNNLRM